MILEIEHQMVPDGERNNRAVTVNRVKEKSNLKLQTSLKLSNSSLLHP